MYILKLYSQIIQIIKQNLKLLPVTREDPKSICSKIKCHSYLATQGKLLLSIPYCCNEHVSIGRCWIVLSNLYHQFANVCIFFVCFVLCSNALLWTLLLPAVGVYTHPQRRVCLRCSVCSA